MYEQSLKILPDAKRNAYGGGLASHEEIMMHQTATLQEIALTAKEMAMRWGTVAAEPSGYDKSGRQAMRLQTAEDLAQRACNTAQALWTEFEKRGWILEVGIPKLKVKKEKVTEDEE
jgi:predicted urease superfamily metal-dependent hydrolase